MPDTTVRVEYIGAVQNFSEVTITGNQQVWRIGSSAFVETGRASQLVASGKFRSLANDPAMLPANQAKVTAIPSESGLVFDEQTTDAIIAIAGDAGSGGTAQIVDGYPVEVTGTSEVLVSAVPCDVVWIAHNGVTGTITVRDAGVTGTGIAAAKTIDMAATATLQPGSLRTQYGVTATLTAGKATLWIRPL